MRQSSSLLSNVSEIDSSCPGDDERIVANRLGDETADTMSKIGHREIVRKNNQG